MADTYTIPTYSFFSKFWIRHCLSSSQRKVTNRPVFFRYSPIYAVSVPEIFDIKRYLVLSRFHASSRLCPDFRILKKYLNVTHQRSSRYDAQQLISTQLCRFWFTQNSPNCMQNFKNFSGLIAPISPRTPTIGRERPPPEPPPHLRASGVSALCRRLSCFWLSEIWSSYRNDSFNF